MQPMKLCNYLCTPFEDTFKNTQWRKVKQVQPMWLCIISGRPFEDTFKNAHRGKVKQKQPMWICILSCTTFEDTFKTYRKGRKFSKKKEAADVWMTIISETSPKKVDHFDENLVTAVILKKLSFLHYWVTWVKIQLSQMNPTFSKHVWLMPNVFCVWNILYNFFLKISFD